MVTATADIMVVTKRAAKRLLIKAERAMSAAARPPTAASRPPTAQRRPKTAGRSWCERAARSFERPLCRRRAAANGRRRTAADCCDARATAESPCFDGDGRGGGGSERAKAGKW